LYSFGHIELNSWSRKTKWSASTSYKLCVFSQASRLLPCTYTHRHVYKHK